MTLIWLGIIIILILIELLTKNLVMIFFAASALISMILSMFVGNYIIQFLVFVIIGTILFITIRDNLIKLVNEKKKNLTSKKSSKKVKKNEK